MLLSNIDCKVVCIIMLLEGYLPTTEGYISYMYTMFLVFNFSTVFCTDSFGMFWYIIILYTIYHSILTIFTDFGLLFCRPLLNSCHLKSWRLLLPMLKNTLKMCTLPIRTATIFHPTIQFTHPSHLALVFHYHLSSLSCSTLPLAPLPKSFHPVHLWQY